MSKCHWTSTRRIHVNIRRKFRNHFGVSKQTISNIWRRYLATQSVQDISNPGCPRITSVAQERHCLCNCKNCNCKRYSKLSAISNMCFLGQQLTLSQTSPCLLYKSFKNTPEKGEIASHEQFLLFPQCFQTTCTANT